MNLYNRLNIAPATTKYERLVLNYGLLLIRNYRKRYVVLVMDLRLWLADSIVVQVDGGYCAQRYPNLLLGTCWNHMVEVLTGNKTLTLRITFYAFLSAKRRVLSRNL